MMKFKLVLFLFAVLFFCPIGATGADFVIRYEKSARLIERGNQLLVVNYDVEWPELLTKTGSTLLQDSLSEIAFGQVCHDGLAAMLRSLEGNDGRKLTQMPDDNSLQKVYINAKVQTLWYEPDKYITLSASGLRSYGDGKQAYDHTKVFTYDIANQRILTPEDIFKPSCLKNGETAQSLYGLITNMSNVSDTTLITWRQTINEPAIIDHAIFFFLTEATGLRQPWQYSSVPVNMLLNTYLNKQFRKWLTSLVEHTDSTQSSQRLQELGDTGDDNDSIETCADVSLPAYKGGYKQLIADMGNYLQSMADMKLKQGRNQTVVSFVVEKDGSLSNIILLKHINATTDREIVNALRLSAGWQALTNNKKPYRAHFVLPLSFILKP